MAQCVACGRFLKQSAVCPSCKSSSHFECVSLPQGVKVADTWRCGACQVSAPKGRDPSTPVRLVEQNFAAQKEPTALDEVANKITAVIAESSEQEQRLHVRALRKDLLADVSGMHDKLVTEINEYKTDRS